MCSVTADSRSGANHGYGYDSAGRMATFSIGGVSQATYTYDFAGRQAIRSLTSPTPVTIHSVFDSEDRRIAEYNEATGALIREYVWLGWEPLAVIEGGQIFFLRTDHIGRPVFATDSSSTKVWTAAYAVGNYSSFIYLVRVVVTLHQTSDWKAAGSCPRSSPSSY